MTIMNHEQQRIVGNQTNRLPADIIDVLDEHDIDLDSFNVFCLATICQWPFCLIARHFRISRSQVIELVNEVRESLKEALGPYIDMSYKWESHADDDDGSD